jgi:hypothetical protein
VFAADYVERDDRDTEHERFGQRIDADSEMAEWTNP